ncbi:uncharacterized protein BT62DRAFT_891405 [Guyanagaster necrorhizus]|uniref:Peptidase S28 n=1 Tax=Guyanagaster necrorhizus TaxID=856835 RepID=A0A9P7VV85_9AGAR|nr:uncharacterized protein BT62DRAFT_891405 [Guyanagaster necrorhizus MCA 3950]KAG7447549.1 hypothetical protein BT62DRAFT_891405 [Guyanagaster necrorhizus MCA 3950]
MARLLGLTFVTSYLSLTSALLSDGRPHGNTMPMPVIPVIDMKDTTSYAKTSLADELAPYNTVYYFDQLIDHNDPSLGTFQQRYWHTYEFYESGGPIILMTPGEANAAPYYGYLTNRTINGLIAQQEHGSVIVVEHRFYGLSNPYPDLTVASLKYHTIQQAIDDLEYFAENVVLPMPNGDQVGPDKAPWILTGGGYAGALTSWTMVNKPNVFWAGYASSAVVETIFNFWRYFEPIRQNMPENCSADVAAVIAYVDEVFSGEDTTAINAIKDEFGLSEMTHLDDVAGALRNNLWDWQSLQPTSGAGAQFFEFCDALEVKDGENAPEAGWGLDHALPAWGTYFKDDYYSLLCGDDGAEDCLGTYNASQNLWTNTSIDNAYRSWNWIVCNEVGFYQDGPPVNVTVTPIVTRLVNVETFYDQRQCQMLFPEAFPDPPYPDTSNINTLYEGWDVSLDRIFFATGTRDPWREATLSAQGLNIPSTEEMPIGLSDGFHCSDLSTTSGTVDATVSKVQASALASMNTWLKEWE